MQTEDFYYSIYAINKKELCNLESQFGAITFPYNTNNYKIPLGVMKPSALKLYMFLLLNSGCRRVDIINKLGYSKDRIYHILNSTDMIVKNKTSYKTVDKRVKNCLFLSKEEIEQYLVWSENEIAVYLYLKFRCGKNNCIQTSIDSIELGTLLSHSIITGTIQLLESKNLVSTVRKEYKVKQDLRESNTYTLLIE